MSSPCHGLFQSLVLGSVGTKTNMALPESVFPEAWQVEPLEEGIYRQRGAEVRADPPERPSGKLL